MKIRKALKKMLISREDQRTLQKMKIYLIKKKTSIKLLLLIICLEELYKFVHK